MVMRHRDTPLGHGASWVLLSNFLEYAARLFVLERVQQSVAVVEFRGNGFRAGSCEVDGADFLFRQFVMMPFIRPQRAREQSQNYQQSQDSVVPHYEFL